MWGRMSVSTRMAEEAKARSAELAACLFRISTGDRRALEDLYQRTSAKLFGICTRILSDRAEAEDILQEVYLTVWNKAAQFDLARGGQPHHLAGGHCAQPGLGPVAVGQSPPRRFGRGGGDHGCGSLGRCGAGGA